MENKIKWFEAISQKQNSLVEKFLQQTKHLSNQHESFEQKSESQKKEMAPKIGNGQGVIVLHQFPRTKNAPSPSPYPMKVETFLRMNKLPYVAGKLRVGLGSFGLVRLGKVSFGLGYVR
jgi:hypothetical protein